MALLDAQAGCRYPTQVEGMLPGKLHSTPGVTASTSVRGVSVDTVLYTGSAQVVAVSPTHHAVIPSHGGTDHQLDNDSSLPFGDTPRPRVTSVGTDNDGDPVSLSNGPSQTTLGGTVVYDADGDQSGNDSNAGAIVGNVGSAAGDGNNTVPSDATLEREGDFDGGGIGPPIDISISDEPAHPEEENETPDATADELERIAADKNPDHLTKYWYDKLHHDAEWLDDDRKRTLARHLLEFAGLEPDEIALFTDLDYVPDPLGDPEVFFRYAEAEKKIVDFYQGRSRNSKIDDELDKARRAFEERRSLFRSRFGEVLKEFYSDRDIAQLTDIISAVPDDDCFAAGILLGDHFTIKRIRNAYIPAITDAFTACPDGLLREETFEGANDPVTILDQLIRNMGGGDDDIDADTGLPVNTNPGSDDSAGASPPSTKTDPPKPPSLAGGGSNLPPQTPRLTIANAESEEEPEEEKGKNERRVVIHNPDYHPEVPSFEDEYRRIGHDIVDATYAVIFVPGRRRYVTGGIATQFYIPDTARRGSNDIDVQDLERKSWTGFKSAISEDIGVAKISHSFEGYDLVLWKRNHSFVLHVCNWYRTEGAQRNYFNTEMARHSQGHHDRMREIFEREFDQTHVFRMSGTNVLLLDPVDIIARKAARLHNYQEHEHITATPVPDDMSEHLAVIWEKRRNLAPIKSHVIKEKCEECAPLYHSLHTELRLICDQYDIRAMLKWGEVDQAYFEDVMRELEGRVYQRSLIDTILGLLPEFSVG